MSAMRQFHIFHLKLAFPHRFDHRIRMYLLTDPVIIAAMDKQIWDIRHKIDLMQR